MFHLSISNLLHFTAKENFLLFVNKPKCVLHHHIVSLHEKYLSNFSSSCLLFFLSFFLGKIFSFFYIFFIFFALRCLCFVRAYGRDLKERREEKNSITSSKALASSLEKERKARESEKFLYKNTTQQISFPKGSRCFFLLLLALLMGETLV